MNSKPSHTNAQTAIVIVTPINGLLYFEGLPMYIAIIGIKGLNK
jgi:hypothetical protein